MLDSTDVTPKGAIGEEQKDPKAQILKHRNTVHLNSAPKNLLLQSISEQKKGNASQNSDKNEDEADNDADDSGSDKDFNFGQEEEKEEAEPDSGTLKMIEEENLRFQMRQNLEKN